MAILLYIIVALLSIYVGKYEKRLNIAVLAAPISVPYGIMVGIAAFLILKFMVLLLVILLAFLSKIKILIKAKVGAILGSIAAAIFGVAAGPIGWVIAAILIFFLIASIQDTFISIYEGIFRLLASILVWIRKNFDSARRLMPVILHPLICIIEAGIVCGFALKGLWELMDILDGKTEITDNLKMIRYIVLLPYALILYRNYLKDTKPPNVGGDGIDSPLLLEFTDAVDAIF